jgi:hypothetical protein
MEAINDSTRLIAQAIDLLKELKPATEVDEANTEHVITLLKTALDKLVVEI